MKAAFLTEFGAPLEIANVKIGKGVQVALDAVGNSALVEDAFMITRKGGMTVLISLMDLEQKISFGHFIAVRSENGCDMGSSQFRADMPRLARLYLDGRLNLDDFLTDRIALSQVNDGFAAMERGEGVRTIIDYQNLGT